MKQPDQARVTSLPDPADKQRVESDLSETNKVDANHTTGRRLSVPCNLCGRTDWFPALGSPKIPLVRCRHCGLVFVSPRLEFPAIVEGRYNQTYFETEYLASHTADSNISSLESTGHLQMMERHFARNGGRPGRLLDVGSGAGFFLVQARNRGWDVQGLEVSPAASEYCREKLGVPTVTGELHADTFPTSSFDAVSMLDVIEHLPDPLRTLQIISSLLKKDGELMIVTPNFASLSRTFLRANSYGIWPDEHLYYFTPATLRKILGAAGFRIGALGTRDIYPANVSRILQCFGGARGGPEPGGMRDRNLRRDFHRSNLLRFMRRFGNAVLWRIHWGDKLVALAAKN